MSVERVYRETEREGELSDVRGYESECFRVPHATCTAVRECQGEAVGKYCTLCLCWRFKATLH